LKDQLIRDIIILASVQDCVSKSNSNRRAVSELYVFT